MAEQPGAGFAGLLRQLRAEARLTQEDLAEAAGLSPRSVSDLERGIHRTARKDTAGLLAEALGLAGPARALFIAAARGRGPTAGVLPTPQEAAVQEAAAREAAVQEATVQEGAAPAAASRTLPRDSASFTGRDSELAWLLEELTVGPADRQVVGIHAIDGMAGIGKTTLAVHAAHRLAPSFPDGQLFLPLHAHTPGQRPVDPADALASLLLTAGLAPAQIPPSLDARAARWRDVVAGKRLLLLLDDAAGHEQVRPLLPGTPGSLVLVTSRRRLAALEDAVQISLGILSPAEAATLLERLAARPGLSGHDAAASELTRLCGYLPLAIAMLASQLRNHPVRTAAGLAAEVAQARDRLALMHAENVSVSAAFGLSHADLSEGARRLFRRLGLVPGPVVDAYAAAALDATGLAAARRHLDELYDHHLIAEPAPGRYQLHDLLREHARTLAADEDPVPAAEAARRLLDYYLHTALAAGRHFTPRGSTAGRRPAAGWPGQAPDVSTVGQAAAWLDAERANLHAAAEDAARRACFPHATALPVAISGFLAARGHWDESAALHQGALAAARQAGDRLGEADALAELGYVRREMESYPAAAASLAQAIAIYGDLDDRPSHAHALIELGFMHTLTGDYPAAAAHYQQALALARAAGDRLAEAAALNHHGLVQLLTGDYPAAAASEQQALVLFTGLGSLYGQAHALSDLGAVQHESGDYPAAAASQQRALALFRDLGDRLGQARALSHLGRVRQEAGDYPAAAASQQRALALFRDLGNHLGQAEALNGLGELATQAGEPRQARDHHALALAIARERGAAPEEARALEGLGHSHQRDGDVPQAAIHLRQALAIYQRIGAPAARRVQQALGDLQP